jgi:hypothetical protein
MKKCVVIRKLAIWHSTEDTISVMTRGRTSFAHKGSSQEGAIVILLICHGRAAHAETDYSQDLLRQDQLSLKPAGGTMQEVKLKHKFAIDSWW